MDQKNATKRGYLTDSYRYFNLKDVKLLNTDYHYHEFYKIVFFIKGNVTYLVEGKSYQLKPWDILFINHHDIHHSLIKPGVPYERMILWISPEFFDQTAIAANHLDQCFQLKKEQKNCLLRVSAQQRIHLFDILNDLDQNTGFSDYSSELYSYTLFLQIMILLNRHVLSDSTPDVATSIQSNKIVDQMIDYIHNHLSKDLSIDSLSKELFLSPSYLMHQFKETTGTSLHSYITRKRLSYAIILLRSGIPATQAAMQSGFPDYSTFIRNFKKYYLCTPTQFLSHQSLFPDI